MNFKTISQWIGADGSRWFTFATRCRLRIRLAINVRYRARHRAREALWHGAMTRADITSFDLDNMARRWAANPPR